MELTPQEALDLLRTLGRQEHDARLLWDAARSTRDDLIRIFDGQEGMARSAMAEAVGITRMALWKILDRGPESVEEDVLLSDDLRRALEDAVDVDAIASAERLRIDVHA